MDGKTRQKITDLVKTGTVTGDDPVDATPSANPSSDDQGLLVDAAPVYDYLNVDMKSKEQLDMANKLFDWAKNNADSEDRADLLWALRDLRNRLGTPSYGISSLQHMYKYTVLQSEKRGIEKEMSLYETE